MNTRLITAFLFWAACGLFLGGGGDLSFAEPATSPPSEPPGSPAPTVTAAMGDVGGKYFGKIPDAARVNHYYIAAEPVLWDFTPEGQDPVCGKALPATFLLNRVSWKIRYVQYADAAFTARILPQKRLGILGPVLRGVTGDTIEVTFLNRAWLPLSMHPHGVKYDKDSEGSYYNPNPGLGAAVAPGAKFTYVWYLDDASGPRPDEPSSKGWLYHSHVGGDEEANLGLVGMIVVTDPKRARADGTPNDVDREMAVLFKIFDESSSGGQAVEEADELPANASPAASGPVQRTWAETQQLMEESQRMAMNGLAFGNLQGLEMNEGERVRWYLFGLGSESDFHTAHWHGLRAIVDGRRRTDVVELLPGSMEIADTVADNPGLWLFHCHVAEHMANGMFARVTVHPAAGPGVNRDPAVAFFGLPAAWQTLKITNAEFAAGNKGEDAAIYLDGEVTVSDPLPVAHTVFTVSIGEKTIELKPDASGIASAPEGLLLVKNISPYGNGNVTGGRLTFELTLKGAGWVDTHRKDASPITVGLKVGEAVHTAACILKAASS